MPRYLLSQETRVPRPGHLYGLGEWKEYPCRYSTQKEIEWKLENDRSDATDFKTKTV